MQMWRLFRPRKYRGQNKRHGFLKEYLEPFDRAQGRQKEVSVLLPLYSSLKRGFTNFSEGVLALIKIRKTFSSLCLCASSLPSVALAKEGEAGGESLRAIGCCYACHRDTH